MPDTNKFSKVDVAKNGGLILVALLAVTSLAKDLILEDKDEFKCRLDVIEAKQHELEIELSRIQVSESMMMKTLEEIKTDIKEIKKRRGN